MSQFTPRGEEKTPGGVLSLFCRVSKRVRLLRYKMKEARVERGCFKAEIEAVSCPRHPLPMKFDYVFRTRRRSGSNFAATQLGLGVQARSSSGQSITQFPFLRLRFLATPCSPFSSNKSSVSTFTPVLLRLNVNNLFYPQECGK